MTPYSSTTTDPPFERLAVVGAGNMGSGIAQKMATEGFAVTLVDLDDEKVARGMSIIEKTLNDGVQRGIFSAARGRRDSRSGSPAPPASRISATSICWWKPSSRTSTSRRAVFRRLDEVCRPDAILATNTSSYAVTELAECDDEAAARRGVALLLSSGEEPAGRGRLGSGDRSGRPSARVAASGGPRQDSDCLERLVRVHRQPVLPAVVDRGRAHARRGRREHSHYRRSREEGLRDRHGTIRAHERHGCADRFSHGNDARPGVRSDVRTAGAAPRSDGIRTTVGHHRDAGAWPVHGRRRSTGHRCVLRRGRARRRARRHDRRHRHRRARGAAVAARPVRADESLRHRARQRSRRRFRGALEPADAGHARRSGSRGHAVQLHAGPVGRRRWRRHADDQSSRRDERAQRGRRLHSSKRRSTPRPPIRW